MIDEEGEVNGNLDGDPFFHLQYHKEYFMLHLTRLPSCYEELDSFRIMPLFFCLSAQKLLHGDNFESAISDKRDLIIKWIYSLQVRPVNRSLKGGFRCSYDMGVLFSSETGTEPLNSLDAAHISGTLLSILSLLILNDNLSRLNRTAVLESLRLMQSDTGRLFICYISVHCQGPDSECDARFLYCACAICYLLKGWAYLDLPMLVSYILTCRNFDGGFGNKPGLESHGGSTFCAFTSLKLIEDAMPGHLAAADVNLAKISEGVVRWCASLQTSVGGFSGRPNKAPDTCYSFWVYATLSQTHVPAATSRPLHLAFLKSVENDIGGGFVKGTRFTFADVYHSFFGVCALSLLEVKGVQPLYPRYMVSKDVIDRWISEENL